MFQTPVPHSSVIHAQDIADLRTAADALRRSASLPAWNWSVSTDALPHAVIHASDINEIRQAITGARNALGLPAIGFADVIAPGVVMKASHITELQSAVR